MPSSNLLPPRLQRRLSVVLSMVVCLWMLAAATHYHAPLDDPGSHHSAKELCGFCASLPAGGAAPSVSTFVPSALCRYVPASAEITLAIPSIRVASYRSRAPPAV